MLTILLELLTSEVDELVVCTESSKWVTYNCLWFRLLQSHRMTFLPFGGSALMRWRRCHLCRLQGDESLFCVKPWVTLCLLECDVRQAGLAIPLGAADHSSILIVTISPLVVWNYFDRYLIVCVRSATSRSKIECEIIIVFSGLILKACSLYMDSKLLNFD